MAQFTATIENNLLPGVLNAFEHAYSIPLDAEGNPTMTQTQNAKKALEVYVRSIYKSYKVVTAAEAARVAAAEAAEIASSGIEVT